MSRLYRIITTITVLLCIVLLSRSGLAAQLTAATTTSEVWRPTMPMLSGMAGVAQETPLASLARTNLRFPLVLS